MFKLISRLKGSEGLSLVEVMIATGIILLGTAAGYALYANVYGTRAGNLDVVQAQGDARNIVESMARELRESSPEVVWHGNDESHYITFFTPRDEDRKFMVNEYGQPVWKRCIGYGLNTELNKIYRYQMYMKIDPHLYFDSYHYEEFASDVEDLRFSRDNDLITISIRTFADSEGNVGHVARSYAEYTTTVKMRN